MAAKVHWCWKCNGYNDESNSSTNRLSFAVQSSPIFIRSNHKAVL